MSTDERLAHVEAAQRDDRADARENARVTAGLAETVKILRENAIQHADRDTVARLLAVQTVHGEDIAVLKNMTDKPTWFDRITGQGDKLDSAKRPALRFAVLVLAIVVALAVVAVPVGWLWYTSAPQQERRDRIEAQDFELRKIAALAAANKAAIGRQGVALDSIRAGVDSLVTGAAPDAP